MRRWFTRSAKPLVAASATITTLMAGPSALAAPAIGGPAVIEQAALTQAAEGQVAVTGAAGKCTWDVNANVGWAYAGGKVKSLVSTDSSAISIIRCPSGWSDFMFSRAQVIKNAQRVGIAKTSECTRAWCTVTVSAAIWHCDDFILCAGYYSGEAHSRYPSPEATSSPRPLPSAAGWRAATKCSCVVSRQTKSTSHRKSDDLL